MNQQAEQVKQEPAQHGMPLRRIMIAVDDSNASKQAVRFAARVAPRDADVRIVCAVGQPRSWQAGGAYTAGDAWLRESLAAARQELRQEAENTLEQAVAAFDGQVASVSGHVLNLTGESGAVVQALSAAASEWRADLLVVGARHQGRVKRWVDGSVSAALAVSAPCPLLVVPAEYEACDAPRFTRMLLATDGSEASTQAIQAAMRLVEPQLALRAIYVVDRSSVTGGPVAAPGLEEALTGLGRRALAAAQEQLEPTGCVCETALVATGLMRDDIAHTVLRDAKQWNADLVVMGTHGRRGVARWLLGSVAQRAVEVTHLPLLLVGPCEG
ncbi:Universal stress protein/MSMEI_3859 [Paraburkholderia caffeinitolerans]|uniref:Universal stress protein/MSMEI_3859 n=1 Tax=Paraburkholderia caffeinitolerans TaxID=1723730 RepID=A0A6J5FMJ5_9BURK|nr:universal stress protein [Paraburkholderia caffeinitolerans]CAB3782990.1 Universal stress protein/MSMEI_3859 [Paraburkholderia caffeinitolerans]